MVSSKQRLIEVGDDGSQAGTVGGKQQGTERGRGQGGSSVGSPAVAKDAAKPKTPRLGGQGGLDTSSWGKGPGAAGFQTMKHCPVVGLQGLRVKGGRNHPAGVNQLGPGCAMAEKQKGSLAVRELTQSLKKGPGAPGTLQRVLVAKTGPSYGSGEKDELAGRMDLEARREKADVQV